MRKHVANYFKARRNTAYDGWGRFMIFVYNFLWAHAIVYVDICGCFITCTLVCTYLYVCSILVRACWEHILHDGRRNMCVYIFLYGYAFICTVMYMLGNCWKNSRNVIKPWVLGKNDDYHCWWPASSDVWRCCNVAYKYCSSFRRWVGQF